MRRAQRTTLCTLLAILVGGVRALQSQEFQIGIIDLYGLHRITEYQVRQALTFKEGDTVSLAGNETPAFLTASEGRVAALPGIVRAHTNCCEIGRAHV